MLEEPDLGNTASYCYIKSELSNIAQRANNTGHNINIGNLELLKSEFSAKKSDTYEIL